MSEIISSGSITDEVIRFIEKTLGLQPDEKFSVSREKYNVDDVTVRDLVARTYFLSDISEHPDAINNPNMTEPERAICKAVGADSLSHDINSDEVLLWQKGLVVAKFKEELFPSIKKGATLILFKL